MMHRSEDSGSSAFKTMGGSGGAMMNPWVIATIWPLAILIANWGLFMRIFLAECAIYWIVKKIRRYRNGG